MYRRFKDWLCREWHTSKALIVLYVAVCADHSWTLDGIIAANVTYHSIATVVMGVMIGIDYAQRRYTGYSLMGLD
jgi:hypothetical protein